MTHPIFPIRSTLLAAALAMAPFVHAQATGDMPAGTSVILQNGRAIPIEVLAIQGDKLVVQTSVQGITAGEKFTFAQADHIYGIKPPAIKQGIAHLLNDKPVKAKELLEPVVAQHRVTAKIPGNFWLEAARALLVTYAMLGDAKNCGDIGTQIAEATPAPGVDPFAALGKALMMPTTTKLDERLSALRELASDQQPVDVAAYAAFFRANLLKNDNRPDEALPAFLEVACLFPSGNLAHVAAAEIQAAEILVTLARLQEATLLLKSAVLDGSGTIFVEIANKRIESLK